MPLEPDRAWRAPDRRVVAVAGIAEPERFGRSLEAAGWTLVHRLDFADHHRYTRDDLQRIAIDAQKASAAVVTTSKDAVRMLPLRPLPVSMACVPLTVSVEPAGQFHDFLLDHLRLART